MRDLRRLRGILTRGLVAGAIVLSTVALATAPANAAAIVNGWSSGPVGVAQTITINGMSTGGTQDGQCSDASEPFTATINGVPQPQQFANVVNGNATITFIPMAAGAASWTFGTAGIGGCELITGAAMSITQTQTVTVVQAPNTATTGQQTVINVLVTSAGTSSYVPTGSVRLNTGFGVNINTMVLTPSFNAGVLNPQAPSGATRNSSFAFLRWTPPSDGTYTFQAVYSGDANALTSTSQVDSLLATPGGGTISFHSPNSATVGTPIALSATVFPLGTTGSVGFTLNGQPISASIPLAAGTSTANFTWTPTTPGTFNIGANYTTNDGRSGSSTPQQIVIAAGPTQSDVITLVQPGFGPWSPNGVYSLNNGTTFTFQATTLSGAAVTLSDTGPCNLQGNTLTVDIGTGQCNIIASSPGGAGFAPVKVGYTIIPRPGVQTAQLAAPRTGTTFQRGRTIRLENPAQGQTNAGQTINWTVLNNSRNNCRLRFLNSGAVNLQLQRAGQCNVRATAPAVPAQWQAFRLNLNYRVR